MKPDNTRQDPIYYQPDAGIPMGIRYALLQLSSLQVKEAIEWIDETSDASDQLIEHLTKQLARLTRKHNPHPNRNRRHPAA